MFEQICGRRPEPLGSPITVLSTDHELVIGSSCDVSAARTVVARLARVEAFCAT
jgi:hypothetical protein